MLLPVDFILRHHGGKNILSNGKIGFATYSF